jgi:glycosyltransferase involved in cell wall biosynthesis
MSKIIKYNIICEYDITFIVPCLNEEINVVNTLDVIVSAMSELNNTYEILVIDDHSSDQTVANVNKYIYRKGTDNIILVKNSSNKGLGTNFVDGSYIGKGRYYMLINGDNVEPKETIQTIVRELGKADMIIPFFGKNDNRPFIRKVLSGLFTKIVNCISGYKISYYNGPILHLRYNVMRWSPDTHGFAYQAELVSRVLSQGESFKEVEVTNIDRQAGSSKAFRIQNILSVGHSLLQILLRRMRIILFGGP